MKLSEPRPMTTRALALSCIMLLVLVASVAAAHACELESYGGQLVKTTARVSPSSGPCPICALAHSPSLAAAFLPFSPRFVVAQVVAASPATRHRSFPGFAVHVRPPPAA